MRRYGSKDKLTLRAAARRLDIDTRTLRKWIALGFVRAVSVGPAEHPITRVPLQEVERLIAKGA